MKKLFLDIRAANEFRKKEVITKLTTQYFHSSSSLSQKRHFTITDKNNKRYAAVGRLSFAISVSTTTYDQNFPFAPYSFKSLKVINILTALT